MDSFRVNTPFLKLQPATSHNISPNVVESCVSTTNFIVTYHSNVAFVFPVEHPNQKPLYEFNKHATANISGMVHICDDVVASVAEDGVLLTWSAETGQVIDSFKVQGAAFTSVSNQNPGMLVVCAHEHSVARTTKRDATFNMQTKNPPPEEQVVKKQIPDVYGDKDDKSVEIVDLTKSDPPPSSDIKTNIPLPSKPAALIRPKPAFNRYYTAVNHQGDPRLKPTQPRHNLYMISHYEGRHLRKTRSLDGCFAPGVIAGHWNILVFNGVLYNSITGKKISDLKPSKSVKCVEINAKMIVIGCADGNLSIYANEPGNKLLCTFNCNDLFSSSTSTKGAVLGVEIVVDSQLIMITTETRGVLFISLKEEGGYDVLGQIIDRTIALTLGFRHAAMLKDNGVCVTGVQGYAALFLLPQIVVRRIRTLKGQSSNSDCIERLKIETKVLKTELGIQKIRTQKLEALISAQKFELQKIEAIGKAEIELLKRAMKSIEESGSRSSM